MAEAKPEPEKPEREKLVSGDTVEIVAGEVADRFGIHAFDGSEGLIVTERHHRDRRFLVVSVRSERDGARSGTVVVPEVACKRMDNGERHE